VTNTLMLTQPGTTEGNHVYVGGGLRRRTDTAGGITQIHSEAFVYGIRTPDTAMPLSGAASFAFSAVGSYATTDGVVDFRGSGLASVDFAARSVDFDGVLVGRLPIFNSGYSQLYPVKLTGSAIIASGGNALLGGLTYGTNPSFSLALEGRFFGSQAEELGGTFYGLGSGNRDLVGLLLAKRGATAPVLETLSSLLAPTSMQVYQNSVSFTDNKNGTYSGAAIGGWAQGEMRVNPATGRYDLAANVFDPTNMLTAENTPQFTKYLAGSGTDTRTLRLYNPGALYNGIALTYMSFGQIDFRFATGSATSSGRIATPFYYGMDTGGNIPRAGHGVYQGFVFGTAVGGNANAAHYAMDGTATLDFDWAASTFVGSMAPSVTDSATQIKTALGTYTFSGGQITPFNLAFNSPIAGPPGTSGQLQGTFFGPAAEEIGASFSLITPNATLGPLVAAGVVIGKR